jgi:hypothetical protein
MERDMSKSRSHDSTAATKAPLRFFSRQLPGEQPLSFETADRLYRLSLEMDRMKPWEFLADQELILVEDRESGEICYCSVMGSLSGALSFQVYIGAESYRFFRRIVNDEPVKPVDFFATVRNVSAEFVLANERTPPDNELLAALGHPKKRGTEAPIFRAQRPGYHPWYLTEGEGRLLVRCMKIVFGFCSHIMATPEVDYWGEEDSFPLMVQTGDANGGEEFDLRVVRAPEPPTSVPQAEALDETLIAGIVR